MADLPIEILQSLSGYSSTLQSRVEALTLNRANTEDLLEGFIRDVRIQDADFTIIHLPIELEILSYYAFLPVTERENVDRFIGTVNRLIDYNLEQAEGDQHKLLKQAVFLDFDYVTPTVNAIQQVTKLNQRFRQNHITTFSGILTATGGLPPSLRSIFNAITRRAGFQNVVVGSPQTVVDGFFVFVAEHSSK